MIPDRVELEGLLYDIEQDKLDKEWELYVESTQLYAEHEKIPVLPRPIKPVITFDEHYKFSQELDAYLEYVQVLRGEI